MTPTLVAQRTETAPDAPGGFATVTRTRFADQAYATLFHKIVTGEIVEGDALPSESELCVLLGISRPVVRTALKRLRAEELIESRRGAGSFVKARQHLAISSSYVAERQVLMLANLEFRTVIEPQAAFFAACRRSDDDLRAIEGVIQEYEFVTLRDGRVGEHLDFRFHHAVAAAAGNRRFVDAIRMVEYDIDHAVNLVRYLARFDHLERSRSIHVDHSRVLREIRARKPERAMAAMQAHLKNAQIRMLQNKPKST